MIFHCFSFTNYLANFFDIQVQFALSKKKKRKISYEQNVLEFILSFENIFNRIFSNDIKSKTRCFIFFRLRLNIKASEFEIDINLELFCLTCENI